MACVPFAVFTFLVNFWIPISVEMFVISCLSDALSIISEGFLNRVRTKTQMKTYWTIYIRGSIHFPKNVEKSIKSQKRVYHNWVPVVYVIQIRSNLFYHASFWSTSDEPLIMPSDCDILVGISLMTAHHLRRLCCPSGTSKRSNVGSKLPAESKSNTIVTSQVACCSLIFSFFVAIRFTWYLNLFQKFL